MHALLLTVLLRVQLIAGVMLLRVVDDAVELFVAAAEAVYLVDTFARLLRQCTRCFWRCCYGSKCGLACCFGESCKCALACCCVCLSTLLSRAWSLRS